MRNLLLAAITLCLAATATVGRAAPAAVVVIPGGKALSSESERKYAESLARSAARMFKEGGLVVDVESDKSLDAALKSRKVAMLVDFATPNASQTAAIRRFVNGGGRLIVTFSSSPELAAIAGVAQGRYEKCANGRFVGMSFVADRPGNIPHSVAQSSANIFTAFPVKGRSRAIAYWTDSAGRTTNHAAWLLSDTACWMTHVLTFDGDPAAKGRLLVALAAHLHPPLWKEAAVNRLAVAGKAGPWQSPTGAYKAAIAMPNSPRRNQMLQTAKEAGRLEVLARDKIAGGRYAVAWMLANDLDRAMKEAYGLMQEPLAGEIRAVWDHSGVGLGDWPRTCRMLKDAGVTDIMVKVAGSGFSYCDLKSLPRSTVITGDQLQACLDAAKPLGLRVHAWLICFSTTEATQDRLAFFNSPQRRWLLDTTAGKASTSWLDPSNPSAREYIVKAATEILAKYRVDGIHLDFVRYPDYYGSLGQGTRARFEASRGKRVANWPDDARKSPVFGELCRWRASRVTALVADIRAVQRKKAPGKLVTAAVLGKYPTCVESVGQDWMSWLECGYVDYVYPMNYTENAAKYAELLAVQMKKRNTAVRVVGGIGVTATESHLSSDQVIDQVNALRRGGAAGFALFDLDSYLKDEILPVLSLGISAKPGKNTKGR